MFFFIILITYPDNAYIITSNTTLGPSTWYSKFKICNVDLSISVSSFVFLFKINFKCVFQISPKSAPITDLYSIRRNIDYGPTTFCRMWHASCNRTQLFSFPSDYSIASTTEIHDDRRQHRLKTLFPLRLRKLTQSSGHRDGVPTRGNRFPTKSSRKKSYNNNNFNCKMIRIFSPVKSPPSVMLIHMYRNKLWHIYRAGNGHNFGTNVYMICLIYKYYVHSVHTRFHNSTARWLGHGLWRTRNTSTVHGDGALHIKYLYTIETEQRRGVGYSSLDLFVCFNDSPGRCVWNIKPTKIMYIIWSSSLK